MSSNSPTLKCIGCESETGWVVTKVELVKYAIFGATRLVFNLDATHHAVVILFGCKHCERGRPVYVTYEFSREGVTVTESYPVGIDATTQQIPNVQPLLYSQAEAIKNGMNWPASAYRLLHHNCQHWAAKFLAKLQNATAEPLFNFAHVLFVEPETGEFLKDGSMVVNFYGEMSISQMAAKALEQSGLKADGYQLCRVHKRGRLLDFSDGMTILNIDHGATIEHRSMHSTKIVSVDIVEQESGLVLRRNIEMQFEKNKFFGYNNVTVSLMTYKALDQFGLKKEGYECCQVLQRNELTNGSIEFVEAGLGNPIQHGALYKVVMVCK